MFYSGRIPMMLGFTTEFTRLVIVHYRIEGVRGLPYLCVYDAAGGPEQ